MKSIVKTTLLTLTLLMTVAFSQVTYNVSGVVQLEGQPSSGGDHSGVQVKFFNLPSMVEEDFTTTNTDGNYSINISPGYYLVEWTKAGYVPWELGGLSLAENTVLDSVIMIPGEVSEVSGTINSTTWTTSYVYYVTDDITVPAGQTLTIDPGVRVKFLEGKSMTVNGTLLANGTVDAHIKFTSKEPTPLPGDWGNLTLNGENNVITYMDYDFATDGITGSNVSGTTINHVYMQGSLALSARGIYFTSGDNLTITNNVFSAAGDHGVFVSSAQNSNISNNTINNPYYGIRAEDCDNCTINNNTIIAGENGIYVPNSFKITINKNNITGKLYWNGIQFTDSDSSTVRENYIERTEQNGNEYSWQYLINGENSEYSTIVRDTLISPNLGQNYGHEQMALRCEWSRVDSNYIEFYFRYYGDHYAIHDDRNSDISHNTIIISSHTNNYTNNIIRSHSSSDYVNSINDNVITYDGNYNRFPYAIWTQSNTIVRNNTINSTFLESAIYVQNNCIVDSNTISGDYSSRVFEVQGDSTVVKNNSITNTGDDENPIPGAGVTLSATSGSGIEFYNNTVLDAGFGSLAYISGSEVEVHHNVYESTINGRGVTMTNQASGSVHNNTFISDEGDYGVYQSNQTNVPVYNNIIVGFNKGIYVDNTIQNYNLAHNLFWDIDAQLFEGTALPPLVGNMIDQNANGLSSDIYNNIEFDPLFVEPDSNDFTLQAASPAVNAGDGTMTDPDGSASDIGAYYYHIYVVMDHAALDNTDDTSGPYRVNATFTSPAGATLSGTLHYAIDGGEYAELTMTAAANDTFYADIPGQALNTTIQYYVSATDGDHTSTLPYNISGGGYSFFVSLFSQFANMTGTSASNGDIELSWGTPIPISGALTGLKLYKSTDPNVALIAGNLIQELDATATTFTDTDTEEGIAYYYKLTGVLDSGTEALVSAEVSVVSDNSTLLRLMGVVQLADATFPPDHSGVKVLMEAVSPTAASDSMVTDVTGEFNVVLSNGMYHVHFTKDGYQPITQGDMFLAVTTTMDTVIIDRGGSREISGNIHGTLSGDTLYFVTGDVTVPTGETLTVEAGTNILFKGNYSFNSNGLLLVNGTENNMVSFTSGAFSPAAGDWGGLNVYETNSRLSYANIHYSTTALYISNVDTVTVNGCEIKNTTQGSDGIRIYDPQYVNIRNNTIDAPNAYGIRKVNSNNDNSGDTRYGYEIVGNTIIADNGIFIYGTHNARVDSNTIYVESQIGINNEYGQNSTYNGNHILPSGNHYERGFYIRYCDNLTIINNEIIGAQSSSIHIWESSSDIIMNNYILYNGTRENDFNGIIGHKENNYFYGNTVLLKNDYHQTYRCRAFYAHDNASNNTFINNKVTIGSEHGGGTNIGFDNVGDDAVFSGNNIEVYNTWGGSWGEFDRRRSAAINGSGGSFTCANDTILVYGTSVGIAGHTFSAEGTIINSVSHHEDYEAILVLGGVATLENISIFDANRGFSFYGAGANLKNVTIETSGDYAISASGTGRTVDIEQSTFVSDNTNGTGVHLEEGVSLNMNSTVIDGYGAGLNASSEATLYSNLFNNSTNYIGAGIADGTGVDNYFNINGDVADMFGNLQMDPQFVDRDGGNYQPSANSPLIDAGSASMPDPDGSLPDIGSHFFNFGYTPKSLTTVSTSDGSVTLSWDIVETDSLTGYQPYYKLATEETWAATLMPTTDMAVEYTNLTNNALYDFAVSALYMMTESNKSPAYQDRPGVPELTATPQQQVVSVSGNVANVTFNIENTGSKDLTFSLDAVTGFSGETPDGFSSLGTFNGHQYFFYQNYEYWTTARNICESFGGHIVVINSAEENEFIRQSINGNETWLGITDEESEGTWLWYNGEPVTYTNWQPGEPNGNSDYGYMYGSGTWDDDGGGRRFVMEVGPQSNFSLSEGVIVPGESVSITDTTNINNGIFSKQIVIESNDPATPVDTIQALVVSGLQANLSSEHFTPVDTTNNVFYYAITSASIDDYVLETGDEIALFNEDICVGAGMYNGVMPFLVKAWGTIPPDEPGFDNGDSITVQAWDFGESRIASMDVTHISGSETFLAGGFAEVSLTGTIYHTQNITITGGMFNLISSYLYPELPSSSTFFGGLEGLRIVYEDNGSALIPEYGINTIGDVELTEGYHLFADGNNQSLTVSGLAINASDWSITLQPNQFNSIAYLHNGAMDAELAMADIASVVNIVQDDAGNAWIPELGVAMGNLNPGKGYQVFTTVDTAVTFTYGSYVAPTARTLAMEEKAIPTQYTFQKTGTPYTIVIQSALTDGHPLEDGDEIAVFDGGLCVGATVWNSETTNIISAWKGDSDYELPGYTPGNTMTFQVYKSRFKTAVDVVSSHPTAEEKAFNGSSYSRTSISGSPGLIPERFALMQNYPNPFNPTTTIRYNVADDSPVTMVIYNIMGQEVIRLINNDIHAPGKYSVVWNGLNQRGENVGAGMYLIRMVSNGFSDTRKMVLLK